MLAEEDDSLPQPWKIFFLGLGLGILLPIFAYFYMHCLCGVQRSLRKRKYFLWGLFLGSLFWGPIVYLLQRLM